MRQIKKQKLPFYEVFYKYTTGLKPVRRSLILKANIKDSLHYLKETAPNSDRYWLSHGLLLSQWQYSS